MALPKSGLITAAMINVELKRAASAAFSLGGTAERKLAKVLSGPISFADFYGKSSVAAIYNYKITSNKTNFNLYKAIGARPEKTIVVTINKGVTISGSKTSATAFDVGNAYSGKTVVIKNYGVIRGKGGTGGSPVSKGNGKSGGTGGVALRVKTSNKLELSNYGSILGGGGGGGGGGGYAFQFTGPPYQGMPPIGGAYLSNGGKGGSGGTGGNGSSGGKGQGWKPNSRALFRGYGGKGGTGGKAGSNGANGSRAYANHNSKPSFRRPAHVIKYARGSGGKGGTAGYSLYGNSKVKIVRKGTMAGRVGG